MSYFRTEVPPVRTAVPPPSPFRAFHVERPRRRPSSAVTAFFLAPAARAAGTTASTGGWLPQPAGDYWRSRGFYTHSDSFRPFTVPAPAAGSVVPLEKSTGIGVRAARGIMAESWNVYLLTGRDRAVLEKAIRKAGRAGLTGEATFNF